ncbi:MAG TPA: RHS repeat-associated core domain-containing protein [Cyclobacteriaceae bacterium]|nr:RHS repeat-associated core domain-containing protein [Cyclobacteriaceae bacterium]
MSHDASENIDVYFDDLYVEHQKGFVVQQTDYFPFGMDFNNLVRDKMTAQNYLYNGKEKQEITNWLDYGARMYMSDIGRWGVIDPLTEEMLSSSTYSYCHNNPLYFRDLNGMLPKYNWGSQTYEDEDGETISWQEAYKQIPSPQSLRFRPRRVSRLGDSALSTPCLIQKQFTARLPLPRNK